MKTGIRLLVLVSMLLVSVFSFAQSKKVYDALSSSEVALIDEQLKSLEANDKPLSKAYEGALLMKKAGLIKGAGKKLEVFKAGREKLEKAIEGDTDNGEFRFLRLMIQENAPDILGYSKSIQEDAVLVEKKYNEMGEEVKNAIRSYSKDSKALKGVSFK